MPKVKIGTQGVSIELEATETSIDALGKQAVECSIPPETAG